MLGAPRNDPYRAKADMTQSIDPEFARRVAEYQRNLKKGIAFQADGTVGGKRLKPARRAWRGTALRNMLKLAIFAVLIKAAVFHGARIVGVDASGTVVLDSAPVVQKAVSLLLYPDPISVELSRWLTLGQQVFAFELRSWL
jgi:hypothetical protein